MVQYIGHLLHIPGVTGSISGPKTAYHD